MTTALWREISQLRGAPQYQFGTMRSTSPRRTLNRLRPLLPLAGITRLARVTDLDTIGIPVYQAVRPNSHNLSVSQGKGLTRAQARISAVMEAVENFHGENIELPMTRASLREMRERLHYDPARLAMTCTDLEAIYRDSSYDALSPPIGESRFLNDDLQLDWWPATNLATGEQSWVPRQLCDLNFSMREEFDVYPFRATSNGLASGNAVVEALIHGLCEVIERDSFVRNAGFRANPRKYIRPESVESDVPASVIQRLEQAGFPPLILDVTGEMGVPCFDVELHETDRPTFQGFGCHPFRDTALVRALTEAAQSRLAHISGTRDDLFRYTYQTPEVLSDIDLPFEEAESETPEPQGRYSDCCHLPGTDWKQMLFELVSRIERFTGTAPVAIDLRREEFGIPVTMVVAPGLLSPGTRR
ncbi:MAG: YcaO-like family protein [Planctomycetota bacterium]